MERWNTIYQFWFAGLLESGTVPKAKQQMWFSKSNAIDEQIRSLFAEDLKLAAQGEYQAWVDHPRSCLALILLFDQFSRNIHRGTPQAFAFDPQARATARLLAPGGAHHKLQPIERVFVYLPFEHSEDLDDQRLSVQLYTELCQEVPAGEREEFAGYLSYAQRHLDVIERFGRFPHRNPILGRPSTTEEEEFLLGPNSSF